MPNNIPTTADNNTTRSGFTHRRPKVPFSMVPAPEIESYDSVPWFRKAWFVWIPLLVPALVIAATGDFYTKANKKMNERVDSDAEVWRSTVANRVLVVVAQAVFLLALANIIWS